MTTEHLEQLPDTQPDAAAETTAGNYFVSNYPPFSFWTKDKASQALEAFQQPPAPGTPLGMYIHIPFCRKRCHFCYFKVYTGKNSGEVRAYLDGALSELRLYAEMAAIKPRPLKYVYFGGGTPSFLSAPQLRGFTDQLKALLPWDQVEEVTFECEPGTLTEKKLEALRALGVTRLSLGVENFNDEILKENGRAHLSKEIHRSYNFARGLGFPQINIDLIAGMLGETDDNWRDSVERALEMEPDTLTVYQMEIPFNTTIYKEMEQAGRISAPVADWETKRRWVEQAFARFEECGYRVSSAYTVVRDKLRTRFAYRDRLWTGADMLALGVASFGHMSGVHFQNEKDLGPYLARLKQGELPIHRALRLEPDELLIREFILQLKLGRISLDYFENKFGVDVAKRFAEPLAEHERNGFLQQTVDGVILTRKGLLRVDSLLPAFYLPQHVTSRYV